MTSTDNPIPEDMAAQRRTWTAQRFMWVLFLVIPALALAGLFGEGPLSDSTAANEALSVEYQRFQRITQLTRYVVQIAPDAPGELRLDANFQKTYAIDSMLPGPQRSTSDRDGVSFAFAKDPAQPLTVVLMVAPHVIGSHAFSVAAGGRSLRLGVFVYP